MEDNTKATATATITYDSIQRNNSTDGTSHVYLLGVKVKLTNTAAYSQSGKFNPAYVLVAVWGGTASQLAQTNGQLAASATVAAGGSYTASVQNNPYLLVRGTSAFQAALSVTFVTAGNETIRGSLVVSIPAKNS